MDRDELLDSLSYLVDRYQDTGGAVGISREEASRLLELYDSGEIQEDDLPLPVAAGRWRPKPHRRHRQPPALRDHGDGRF